MELPTYPCPRCGRVCQADGELAVCGEIVPVGVFSCETCIDPWTLGDTTFDAAFSFVVAADGTIYNGATWEPIPPSDIAGTN